MSSIFLTHFTPSTFDHVRRDSTRQALRPPPPPIQYGYYCDQALHTYYCDQALHKRLKLRKGYGRDPTPTPPFFQHSRHLCCKSSSLLTLDEALSASTDALEELRRALHKPQGWSVDECLSAPADVADEVCRAAQRSDRADQV